MTNLKSFYVTRDNRKDDEEGEPIFVLVETRSSEIQKDGAFVKVKDVNNMLKDFIPKSELPSCSEFNEILHHLHCFKGKLDRRENKKNTDFAMEKFINDIIIKLKSLEKYTED